jgi:hypothetical protein
MVTKRFGAPKRRGFPISDSIRYILLRKEAR